MRVLVTNDDGCDSLGLKALSDVAVSAGLDVVTAAPRWDASGASASLSAQADEGRVVVEQVSEDGRSFGVEGPPAFIVRAAIYGAFGPPPDVILSGINRGINAGRAIIHSGTVGAALTASIYGRRGLAVSADVGETDNWGPAAVMAGQAIEWLLSCPESTVLNLNVPDTEGAPVRGVRSTTLAVGGVVQGSVSERQQGLVAVTFSEDDGPPEKGTDVAALAAGYAALTAVRPVCEDERFDLAEIVGS